MNAALPDTQPVKRTLKDGDVEWRLPTGDLHRLDGPAYVSGDGIRSSWYVNGRRHRLDGPAVTTYAGRISWFVDGHRVIDLWEQLNDLYEDGEIELITHVLSLWRPDGPPVRHLIRAVTNAHS